MRVDAMRIVAESCTLNWDCQEESRDWRVWERKVGIEVEVGGGALDFFSLGIVEPSL